MLPSSATSGCHIRRATVADIEVITHHRLSMFLDMGTLTAERRDELNALIVPCLREFVANGDYVGWLAAMDGEPERIVAGAGAQIRQIQPSPWIGVDGTCHISRGRQAIVMNVYTEPAFRRRGLARALMHEVMGWAREAGIETLVLHAAPDGRPLYESLGFLATNEMRYAGDLATWSV